MTAQPPLPATLPVNAAVNGTVWDTEVLQEKAFQQEVLLGTNGSPMVAANAVVALPQAQKNLLVNGGFEVYQRGTSNDDPTGAGTCIADGWASYYAAVARDAVNIDPVYGGQYALASTPHGIGPSPQPATEQIVYEVERLRGRNVSFWGRVKSANQGYVQISDGTSVSNTIPITEDSSGWVTHITTLPVSPTATTIAVTYFAFSTSPYYLDNFMLTPTDGPVKYLPLNPAEEQYRRDRRYAVYRLNFRFRANAAGEVAIYSIPFRAPMLAVPGTGGWTLSGVSGTDYSNVAATALVNPTTTEIQAQITATAASVGTWVYGQTVIVDAGVF